MPVFDTRLTPELIERYSRSGHWRTGTFYQLLAQRAEAHPDREAIIDARQRISYGQLRAGVDRVAAAFQHLGIGPGDVVSIQLPNWIEFACVFFAMERVGAIANQIGPDFRSREVEYILRFSESRAFVCPATFRGFDYVPMIRALWPGLPALKTVCVLGGTGNSDTASLDEILAGARPSLPLVPRTSATTRTRPRTPSCSPPTAGFVRVISASSTPPAT
jgi:non-ribosomal peptide synthetase component E (peptide arylation enzyme)